MIGNNSQTTKSSKQSKEENKNRKKNTRSLGRHGPREYGGHGHLGVLSYCSRSSSSSSNSSGGGSSSSRKNLNHVMSCVMVILTLSRN
jgi:hypothetical protein